MLSFEWRLKQFSTWFVFVCSIWSIHLVQLYEFRANERATLVAAAAGLQAKSSNSSAPYWRRPGCYQVGHTRTISIPGCVKFNLSTNACRGYCMSFSIPAAEDIGPASLDADAGHLLGTLLDGANGGQLWPPAGPNNERRHTTSGQADKRGQASGRLFAPTEPAASGRHPNEHDHHHHDQRHQYDKRQDFVQLIGGANKSPLDGAIGDSSASDKRDVISVGQCCNMMETEDVTVNLRCGLNETRKLVFKSAKSCECFFCKHV